MRQQGFPAQEQPEENKKEDRNGQQKCGVLCGMKVPAKGDCCGDRQGNEAPGEQVATNEGSKNRAKRPAGET